MIAILLGVVLAAACGSVPFAWIVHRARTGGDLRREGSGNPGATNVLRLDGGWAGAGALLLDLAKGAAAVALARAVGGLPAEAPAALAAVLAHVYSPWLGFRGGRGVAPAAGAFGVAAPLATVVALVIFSVVAAVTRWASAGSVAAAAGLAAAAAMRGPRSVAVAAAAAAVLIAWRHRENFARMRDGTEPRIGRARSSEEPSP